MTSSADTLVRLIETVHRLRAPGGCPWDRAQTHQSLRQYLIEEAYEVMDVLDQIHSEQDLKKEKIRNSFREELGDLLMQVLLHSEMAKEQEAFDIFEVAKTLDEKLVRRHPHVFGEMPKAQSAESAFQNWEKQKAKEKASDPNASILDGMPRGLPSLQRASRVIEKVTKVGFQWPDMAGPLEKVEEELRELKAEVLKLENAEKQKASNASAGRASDNDIQDLRKALEGELGDLFFTLANLAFLMKINPEDALRATLAKFERRFRHVEKRVKETGKTPEHSTLEEMDRYWVEAKMSELDEAKTSELNETESNESRDAKANQADSLNHPGRSTT